MIKRFEPKHLIAIVVIVGGFILIAMGADGYVTAIITLVVGYFFGSEHRAAQRVIVEDIERRWPK